MELNAAINFIENAVVPRTGVWADIGAGSGIYTLALDQVLETGSTIYAADKNPHMLYRLELARCQLIIEELDFTREFRLPALDGVIMANALHYAPDPETVMKRITDCLKPDGSLLMIEYETDKPLRTWIPYPVPLQRFRELADNVGLRPPEIVNQIPSAYGHEHIYLATTGKMA